MTKGLSINEFIEKFSEFNSDLPGECVEAVLKRLFDCTHQIDAPYREYLIYKTFLENYQQNGGRREAAELDTSFEYKISERTVKHIVEKYRRLERYKNAS